MHALYFLLGQTADSLDSSAFGHPLEGRIDHWQRKSRSDREDKLIKSFDSDPNFEPTLLASKRLPAFISL